MTPRAARALIALAVPLALAATAAAATPALRFASFPQKLIQGQGATVTVVLRRAADRCALDITYPGGRRTHVAATARNGRASWAVQIAKDATPGTARAVASCARTGTLRRSFVVVGSVIPPRIDVAKQGWSVRQKTYGGSTVSYGLLLANRSDSEDAVDVNVLVNFVDAANKLIGTATGTVPAIGAGTTYAYGDSLDFPGGAPVARLEVVIQIGSHQPKSQKQPVVANVRVLPDPYDAAWLGSVEGEIVNADPALQLQRATLSAVILDASGNVIGGATGYALASLPPGAREFFKATSDLKAVPLANAASAIVSVSPTYGTRA